MPSSSAAAAIPNNPMVSSLLAGLRPAADTPLRLRLWNGLEHDFSPNPRVTVALGAPGAIRYFLPPSLDNLAEGYVSGKFVVQGNPHQSEVPWYVSNRRARRLALRQRRGYSCFVV